MLVMPEAPADRSAVHVSGERLTIRAERRDRICVVAVSGPLDRNGSAGLTETIRTERAAHPARLVIDMSGVGSVDIGGARALAAAARPVPGQCPVIVRSLRPSARHELERSGLHLDWLGRDWLARQTAPAGSAPNQDEGLADSVTGTLVREWGYLHGTVERAIADSRRTAQSLASTEDHVAATMRRLAARRPGSAARLEALSQTAGSYALQLRGPLQPATSPEYDLPPYTPSSTVGRAVTFIEEHAHEDMSVADIAAAAFVTARAVQLAFRRYLDTTPLGYLRQVRLEHAHRQLLSADPGCTTVTAVAAGWRFPNSSRFSAYYRAAYGQPPARTLRQRNPEPSAGVTGAALGRNTV